MPRVRPGCATRRRHKRVLNAAKGYRGGRSKLFREAKQAVIKAGQYAYRDRRNRKRDFRALWIIRVSAACDARAISYSRFMNGLAKADVALDRKVLAEMAVKDPAGFAELATLAQGTLDTSS